ncbi:MAG: hypothetical protein JO061_20975, partial [Acidobacteriaceae bacterium]|nr:hypothetical protein [Acidobacteriaceae bacterium]
MKMWKPGLLIAGFAVLLSCSRLPGALHSEIGQERDLLDRAEHELQHSKQTLETDLSQVPDLFRDASAPAQWNARLQADRQSLQSAEEIQNELNELARRDRADSKPRVEQLLTRERQLLDTTANDSRSVLAAADKWLDFRRDVPSHLDQMRREYAAVCNFDLAPVAEDVGHAGHDWPAKKPVLDERLEALRNTQKQAETEWSSTQALRDAAANTKVSGQQLATLIQTDDHLTSDASTLNVKTAELHSLSGQLYDSWDKILTDLDDSGSGETQVFRERIKTVRTHLLDVPSKKSETTSQERWVTVSEPQFRAVQNDVGMAIAHKDAGLFDSEAQNVPQPAGFAYIAPESQGRNQYGYWDHSSRHSVWTWLPEYLILRELLWNHDYRPVIADEYRGYQSAQTAGKTYYGQTTPAAPPKYGTHGTFTQSHYADSRYVQKGGFKSSGYASHPGTASSGPDFDSHNRPGNGDNGAGRRFGSGAHAPTARQFGRPGG